MKVEDILTKKQIEEIFKGRGNDLKRFTRKFNAYFKGVTEWTEGTLEAIEQGYKVACEHNLGDKGTNKLLQGGPSNRAPEGLIKKEGKGVFSLKPYGHKADGRLVMVLDPQNKSRLILHKFVKHDNQYSAAINSAKQLYETLQTSRMPLSAGLTAKINEKVAQKTGAKLGTKAALKVGVKKLPGIGLVFGTVFAGMSAVKGDWQGAGMEFCSGLASCVPGWGTATSFAIDAALIAREAQKGR